MSKTISDKKIDKTKKNKVKVNTQYTRSTKQKMTNNNNHNKVNTISNNASGTELNTEPSMKIKPLSASQLKKCTDPHSLPTSSEKSGRLNIEFGQHRAIKAINTALAIKANGYHVFAAGENGLGKRTLIKCLLADYAKNMATPDDLVYVYNFTNPREPIAIKLPAGKGIELQKQVQNIWNKTQKVLKRRFHSDKYHDHIEAIRNNTQEKESQAYEELTSEAKIYNLELQFRGLDNKAQFVDIEPQNTEPQDIEPTENQQQVKPTRATHSQKNYMLKRFSQLAITLDNLEDEVNQAIDKVHQDIAKRVINPIFSPVIKQFRDNQPATSQQSSQQAEHVITYLKTIQADMIEHVEHIVNQDNDEFVVHNLATVPTRYCVNVVASHQPDSGAPIVFEDLPTHLNLLGHVEQVTHLGSVTTDVSMIRGGSLHQANGGFLLLEANGMLEHAYAWQGLKRALQSKKIKLSSLEQMLTLTGSLSLSPTPVELDVKVILLGEAGLYYELIEFEPEFNAVFKIRADFHDDIDRDADSEKAMADKIADIIKQKDLLPFDNFAQASIIDHLSLLTDEQNKLSLHSDRLLQLLAESNQHAKLANVGIVSDKHVSASINDINERSNYLRDLYWQEIENGQQIINTRGSEIGQINALTVISYADSEFGMPARLTALIQPKAGHGEILDIERDVNLGGNLHAKGMLIQTSYLRSLFSQFYDLNFSASLAFEQNYVHIDGDSATLAESCALISALSQVAINQSFAITGSMNQLGEVQAVGGINAKITGFYDTCFGQGLTAKDNKEKVQGVIIPHSNIHNLMLRDDIIEAVDNGEFVIYAVNHLHQALHLLTGMTVDCKTKKGKYRKDCLFGKVAKHLKLWEDSDE